MNSPGYNRQPQQENLSPYDMPVTLLEQQAAQHIAVQGMNANTAPIAGNIAALRALGNNRENMTVANAAATWEGCLPLLRVVTHNVQGNAYVHSLVAAPTGLVDFVRPEMRAGALDKLPNLMDQARAILGLFEAANTLFSPYQTREERLAAAEAELAVLTNLRWTLTTRAAEQPLRAEVDLRRRQVERGRDALRTEPVPTREEQAASYIQKWNQNGSGVAFQGNGKFDPIFSNMRGDMTDAASAFVWRESTVAAPASVDFFSTRYSMGNENYRYVNSVDVTGSADKSTTDRVLIEPVYNEPGKVAITLVTPPTSSDNRTGNKYMLLLPLEEATPFIAVMQHDPLLLNATLRAALSLHPGRSAGSKMEFGLDKHNDAERPPAQQMFLLNLSGHNFIDLPSIQHLIGGPPRQLSAADEEAVRIASQPLRYAEEAR